MSNQITREEFADIFNDVESYPTLKDVALEVGTTVQSVKNRAGAIKKAHESGKDEPFLVSRKVPLTEIEEKFRPDWSAADCLEELVRIATASPNKFITRNFFRVESGISEATWTRYFGKFAEFKRQAGINTNRGANRLELNISRHVSVDHYRDYTKERQNYGDRYTRDKPGRWKTILVGSDLHDIEVDPFWLRVFLDTARRVQPDVINLNGDVFDLPEFGRYNVDPRTWDAAGRIKHVHDAILRPLREACPDSTIDLIEGNHEFRLVKHLADQSPAMMAVLADLHGMTISQLFGLEEFEVNYVAQGQLEAWNKGDIKKELKKNYKIYYDAAMANHFPQARQMGMPGWNGHHHSHIVWSEYNPMFGAYEWHQMGCGHMRRASYCNGAKWNTGFALVHINTETKSTLFDYCYVGESAVVGGVWYDRLSQESVAT